MATVEDVVRTAALDLTVLTFLLALWSFNIETGDVF